jgi:nucleoside-diphosphate-sugar epimerase
MKVFITGGGRVPGYRLALRLLERKTLAGLTGSPHPFPGSNQLTRHSRPIRIPGWSA